MSRAEAVTTRRASAQSWWTGGLFAIGSLCFGIASMPWYFDAAAPAVVAWTFFIGSVFFTSAGLLQFLGTRHGPRDVDWWAAGVQLIGTLWFNVSTFAATLDLDPTQDKRLIWTPDLFGSICFLVASWLAYAAVNRGWRPRREASFGWRIAVLNMLGSIAFGVAAIAARYVRSTGEIANLPMVNLGTFVGAVCFFVGALLLPLQSARDTVPT